MRKVFLLTVLLLSSFAFIFFQAEEVVSEIDESDIFDFYGFSWSENIGWLSFNSVSDGSSTDYSVTVGLDGKIRGYGWSEHIGWVKFDGLSGYPEAPYYSVKVDMDGYLDDCEKGQVCGWAKALVGEDHDDGWDGWINFNAGDNGVSFVDGSASNSELFGWAWGSDVVGWISTSCENPNNDCSSSNYKVQTDFVLSIPIIDNPDSDEDIEIIHGDYCHRSDPIVYSQWNYESSNNVDQDGFQVQIVERGNSFDGEGYDPKTGSVDPCSNCILPGNGTYWEENSPYSKTNQYILPDTLDFDSKYTIRVQVWDKYGIRSEWAVKDFKTRIRHPEVHFIHVPPTPITDEVTYFYDKTNYHDWMDGDNRDGNIEMRWQFENGEPSLITGIYPDLTEVSTTFTQSGANQTTLTVSANIRDETEEGTSYIYESCQWSKGVGTRVILPDWQEVDPF